MPSISTAQINADHSQLLAMMDHTDVSIAYLDEDFNFVAANKAFAENFGKSLDELIDKNYFDLFPNKENFRIFKMVRESGRGIQYHARPLIFDDQPVRRKSFWDWAINPVKGEDGRINGVVLTLKEVSDQFKDWIDSRKSAIKRMVLLALTIFLADLLIMLVFNFFDDTQSTDFFVLDPFVLACFLLPFLYYFYIRPLLTNVAKVKETKNRLLESFEKLEAERKRLFSILDELPASVHLLRSDHTIAYANRYFRDQFGYASDTPCYKLLHGSDSPCNVCNALEVFNSGKGGEAEEIHSNGRVYKLYNYPFKDMDGSSMVLQLGIDLTKQKEYEERLIQTEKLMAVAEMSAMISHEFRNSLTSIRMILELQRESDNLNPGEQESLDVVLNSIGHMEGIVKQLLNYARPEPMMMIDLNLNIIIQDSIDFIKLKFNKENVKVRTDLDQSLPDIPMDMTHMREALVNLMLNGIHAISANKQPGNPRELSIETVAIQVDGMDKTAALSKEANALTGVPSDEIPFRPGQQVVLLTIKDTGIGIAKEELDKVFNPFYTRHKSGGTGLGLTMVKRTVAAHKGIITVESEPGKGTYFKIYLPANKEKGSGIL